MPKDNPQELLPLVDETGRVVGQATRRECHNGSHLLHPVVHLHLFRPDGALFLQHRPAWKDVQPNRWDTAVGGHVDCGETTRQALLRETREELGLEGLCPRQLWQYVHENAVEREWVSTFGATTTQAPYPSAETAGGRFWTFDEIRQHLGTDAFTPNFEAEFKRLEALSGSAWAQRLLAAAT